MPITFLERAGQSSSGGTEELSLVTVEVCVKSARTALFNAAKNSSGRLRAAHDKHAVVPLPDTSALASSAAITTGLTLRCDAGCP